MTSNVSDSTVYDSLRLKDMVPFIRSIMTLLPLGIGVVYNIPSDIPESFLGIPKDALTYVYHEFYRNMTDLSLYPLRALYDVKYVASDEVLNVLKRQLIKRFCEITRDVKQDEMIVQSFSNVKSKFDWIDLVIIKELEKDPFLGVESLSKRLNIPISRIRRHLIKHVSRLNRGIRIRKMPFFSLSEAVKLIMVFKFNNVIIASEMIDELIRCPLIIMCGLNVETGDVLVQAIPSVVDVRRVIRFFSNLSNELGFDFSNFFIAVSSRSYTVPFIRDKEYTPAVGWRFKERSS